MIEINATARCDACGSAATFVARTKWREIAQSERRIVPPDEIVLIIPVGQLPTGWTYFMGNTRCPSCPRP